MNIIELIYLVTTFIAVFTALPQIKQLWVMKDSDEFNLFTWVMWCLSQVAALVYSISIRSLPYLLVNIGWIAFYFIMIALIIRYRNGSQSKLVREDVSVDSQ